MPYVNLDTIQRPVAGSTVPVAQWGAQVNDNFAAINAELATYRTSHQVWGLYTAGQVLAEGNVTVYDDLHVDGYVRAGAGNPLWRVQRYAGTLDGAGNGVVIHNISDGGRRCIISSAYYKGNSGEAVKVTRTVVDGTGFHIWAQGQVDGGGPGSKPWRGAIMYSLDAVVW